MPDLPAGNLLITGATGFLGGAVVRQLLQRGAEPASIRCLVRDRGRAEALGIPAASIVLGDLADREGSALAAAMEGVATVLHLAGAVTAWRRSGFEAVNVAGTAALVAAAQAAETTHFVFVSSLAAAGPSIDGSGSSALPDLCRPVSAYGDSKRRAELAVVAGRVSWTIVRPPVVYGPGDAATRLLFRQVCAPLTVVPRWPQPLSVIHCDDVVEALIATMIRRPNGAVLPLDGAERTDSHGLLRAIAVACGRQIRFVHVPMALAFAAAGVSDVVAALRRRASFFSRDKMREIRAAGWIADGEVARRHLDFEPRVPLATGLAAVARAEGFAPPPTTT